MGRLLGVAAILVVAMLAMGAADTPASQPTGAETMLAQGLTLLDQ